MLTIRLQRTGRRGHAQYRMIVQDSRFSPKSGRVVSYVGNYDPHTKESQIDEEAVKKYLKTGAQPSPRVISLLKSKKIAVPKWAQESTDKKRSVRNPEKRRSTAPEAPAEEAAPENPASETPEAETPAESAETPAESPAPEAEAPAGEAPAEEKPEEEQPAADEKPAEAEAPAEPAS